MYEYVLGIVKELQDKQVDENKTFYWITRVADEKGNIQESCCSVFDGYTKDSPRRELRKAREIDPIKTKEFVNKLGENAVFIDNDEDIWVYDLYGGHAIIEKTICEEYYPYLAFPFEVVQLNPLEGYISVDKAPQKVLNRVPTKKNRMDLLKRDRFRCRLCGRSPKDYVDVELHLHHILPWAQGGLTIDYNLITLCKTCHDGLIPHYEKELFSYIEIDCPKSIKRDFQEKLSNYQKLIMKELSKQAKNKK